MSPQARALISLYLLQAALAGVRQKAMPRADSIVAKERHGGLSFTLKRGGYLLECQPGLQRLKRVLSDRICERSHHLCTLFSSV